MRKEGIEEFLVELKDHGQVMDAILSIVHPELYSVAQRSFEISKLENPESSAVFAWPCCFSGMSVICNRLTPKHKDRRTDRFWYDFLTSAGHHKKAALKAAGIGYSFDYAPGTMVALCAADIFHEVDLWYGFDRICIASFMRKSVMKARNLLIPAASTLDQFTAQMDSEFLVNYSKLLCRS